MKKQEGFTLIELSMVVLMIGILAALAIPRYAGAARKAKLREPARLLKQMWELEYIYYSAEGHSIAEGGIPVYFGLQTGVAQFDENNRRKLNQLGFSDPGGVTRFYYVTIDEAITYAFPKTSHSPFTFPDDEIDNGLLGYSLAIDNDGKIYIFHNGKSELLE